MKNAIAVLGIVISVFLAGVPSSAKGDVRLAVREVLLGPKVEDPVFSNDYKNMAYVESQDGKKYVVVNGQKGKQYAEILGLRFCGTHMSYWVKEGAGYTYVYDGKEAGPYESFASPPIVSPDGKRLAYKIVSDPSKYPSMDRRIIVDGVPGKEYDSIDAPTFSPDSKHFAYIAKQQNKCFVVLDGVEGRAYDSVEQMQFNPAAGQLVYVIGRGERKIVVQDRKESSDYQSVSDIVWSANGKSIGYQATNHDIPQFFVNGREMPRFDGIIHRSLRLSPDGKHSAYIAHHDNKQVVVLDGVPGQGYDSIKSESMLFAPVGGNLFYTAQKAGKSFMVLSGIEQELPRSMQDVRFTKDGKLVYQAFDATSRAAGPPGRVMVVGDQKYSLFGPPSRDGYLLSPDGSKIVYINSSMSGSSVVVDGNEGKTYKSILQNSLTITPDGKHVGYIVRGFPPVCVIDEKEYPVPDVKMGIEAPVLSPDGEHIACVIQTGIGSTAIAVNGTVSPEMKYSWMNPKLVFDSMRLLHTLTIKGDQYYRVEVEIL